MTNKQLQELLASFPDDLLIIGQALTPEGTWLNMPVEIGKAIGDNKLLVIQLKPIQDSK